VSPRKSSTSSGSNRFDRPRYLLVEVVGAPTLSPRALETALFERLPPTLAPVRPRVIRSEGAYALVAIPHTLLAAAVLAWNGPGTGGRPLRTLRTYGTLRKGKEWLARARNPRVVGRRAEPPASPGV